MLKINQTEPYTPLATSTEEEEKSAAITSDYKWWQLGEVLHKDLVDEKVKMV